MNTSLGIILLVLFVPVLAVNAHADRITATAVDKSYTFCYCNDLALIKGAATAERVTVYCDCVCDFTFTFLTPCSWSPNIGWHRLQTVEVKDGIYHTKIFYFLNTNMTAPYFGTTYSFYTTDGHVRSPVVEYLSV